MSKDSEIDNEYEDDFLYDNDDESIENLVFNGAVDHEKKSARRRLDDYFDKKSLQDKLADYY